MKKLFPLLIGLVLFCKLDAFGGLYFWDTNGSTPGSGSAAPTGTWGVDAYWNEDGTGGDAKGGTKAWPSGSAAAFSAGSDAVGAYTVYVSGIVTVMDIHVDRGTVTFDPAPVTGGSLKLTDSNGKGANRLLTVGAFGDETIARYNVPITDATSVFRCKRGTLILGATNTFTGVFTIEGGVVQCAVPYALAGSNALVLANNDPARDGFSEDFRYTPAVFNSGGFDQGLGTLKLDGIDPTVVRALNLGNGAGTLSFEDSSTEDWGAFTLTIQDYAPGSSKLRFGKSNTGLATWQVAQIQFADFPNVPVVIDDDGYVTPNLPKITAITPASGSVELGWTALFGRTYRVWSKDTLAAGTWDKRSDVLAVAETAAYTDSTPSATGRFYRIELLP